MVRQARLYLLSAMSGASLIAAAIVAFVLLVSAQVFTDLPIAGLVGGGDEKPSLSTGRPAAAGEDSARALAGAGPKGADGGGRAAGGGAGGSAGAGDLTGQGPGGSVESPGGGGAPGGEATGGGGGGSAPASPGGSGGSSGGGGGEGGSATSPSGQVTGTVNETVNQVDETVTGGALEESGATEVTEEAVNGVAGPESTIGQAVDQTAGAVEGVVGGK